MYSQLSESFQNIVEENNFREKNAKCEIIARGFVDKPPKSRSNPEGAVNQDFRLPSEEYALVKGKEVLIRCQIDEYYGDAFTDKPRTHKERLGQMHELASGDRGDRAIFFATLNAMLHHLGMIEKPIHCKEGDPKKCGRELAEFIMDKFGKAKVAHIGYQPGHIEACSNHFESYVTDLNPENIGKEKFGRKILNGEKNEEVIKKVDVACITGSTVTNGTLPELIEMCDTHGTEPIIYGVSAKGTLELLNMTGFCPYSREKPE